MRASVYFAWLIVIICLIIINILIYFWLDLQIKYVWFIAYGQENEWSEWVDPDNQFNLRYPSDPLLLKGWVAISREDRFEDQDVIFAIDGNGSNLRINVYNRKSVV